MNVGITGASGFVGGALARRFAAAGWCVTPLGRREVRRYDLAEPVAPGLFGGLDALVHAAYGPDEDNVAAAGRLVRAARESDVGTIAFISSLMADANSASRYGRDKQSAEQTLHVDRDIIIRPGLIAGDGGLYGAMRRAIRRFGVVPIFGDGQQPVYLVGIDELADAVTTLLTRRVSGMFVCGSATPIAFSQLCETMATAMHRTVRRIRLPLAPMLAVLNASEAIGLRLPISSESVRGIANLHAMDIPDYSSLGLRFAAPSETILRVERDHV